MKKITAIISLTLLVCILASCSSCTKELKPVSGGNFYDKDNDIVYSVAPTHYEAAYWAKEIYMEDNHGFGFHIVTDKDGHSETPPQWLYNYENNILLYNSDITLPTLKEMDPESLAFYTEGESKIYLTEEKDIEAVKKVTALLDGPSVDFSANAVQTSYKISFYSSKYPCIAYTLIYMEYTKDHIEYVSLKGESYSSVEEIEAGYSFVEGVPYEILTESDGSFTVAYNYGKYFLYNRDMRKCYMAKYIHDTYNSDDTAADSENAA